MDRLSQLPDSLIFEILSFLKTRDVVRTTLLSKGWKDLWTTTPYLDFDESSTVEARNFINETLMLWKGTRILRFGIRLRKAYDATDDLDSWVRFATERKVEVLYLDLPYDSSRPSDSDDRLYRPPHCMYSCSSITMLTLIGCDLQSCGNVRLDNLKGLKITTCLSVSEDVINRLISGAPHLERLQLRLSESDENLSIRSSCLKALSIRRDFDSRYVPAKVPVLTIRAPKLRVLALLESPYGKCLLKDVSSLTHLVLGFVNERAQELDETLRGILPAIRHVEALILSPCCFKNLGIMKGKYSVSPLAKVKLLICDFPIKPKQLVGLLEIFPKLQALVMELDFFTRYPKKIQELFKQDIDDDDVGETLESSKAKKLESLLEQMRRIEIRWSLYEAPLMFPFTEFLLKHATMVKKIVFEKRGSNEIESKDMSLAVEKVANLQISHPTVEFIFYDK